MFDKLFYRTVALYYKENEIKENDDQPFIKIYMIHVGALAMLLTCIRYAIVGFVYGPDMYKVGHSKMEIFSLIALAFVVGYLLFLRKKRFRVIFNKYSIDPSFRTWKSKAIIITYFLFSFASPFILSVCLNLAWFGVIAR